MSKKLGLGLLIVIALFIGYKLWGNYNNQDLDIPQDISAVVQFEEAQKNGQPVWLMFGTTNCPYCVELKKIYDELQPKYEGKVVFIDVNLDMKENYDLGREYQIRYVPVTYIYDKDGNISFEQGGLLEKDVLISELDKVALD